MRRKIVKHQPVFLGSDPIRLGVFVSGTGRSLKNLIALDYDVRCVLSNTDCPALQWAFESGYRAASYPAAGQEDSDKEMFNACDDAGCDLVVLAGYKRFLNVPEPWMFRVMNIHPSLLPAFGGNGMYGHHVHDAVIRRGVKFSGCTVHFVTPEYDAGPIIVQKMVEVAANDTSETIAAKVFELEKIAYPEAINLYYEGRLRIVDGRVHIAPPFEDK